MTETPPRVNAAAHFGHAAFAAGVWFIINRHKGEIFYGTCILREPQ